MLGEAVQHPGQYGRSRVIESENGEPHLSNSILIDFATCFHIATEFTDSQWNLRLSEKTLQPPVRANNFIPSSTVSDEATDWRTGCVSCRVVSDTPGS